MKTTDSVLITGGTGSYGQELAARLLSDCPSRRVVIYSRDEMKQEAMARDFDAWNVKHPSLRFFIGDVRDRDRLEFAMRGITTVVHAAAMKIVPTAEYNPTECIATNIGGAENVVKASIRSGVKRVLALSTDKAVNPINLYGASKLAAEKVFIAANSLAAGSCAFSVMRYGNVVGSRGSVIPLFKSLIKQDLPLTVTDARMTRFWITLKEAVGFSMNVLERMSGREIYIPKIPSANIMHIAAAFTANYNYNKDVTIIGIRSGEKLHEVLINEDEARFTVKSDIGYTIYPYGIPELLKSCAVPDGFRYSSDSNDPWMHVDDIRKFV